jgi:hypothetical protein
MAMLVWVTVLHFAGLCGITRAGPLEHWHWRTPEGTGRNLHAIAFGLGRFIAVGDGGTIVTTVDGLEWQPVDSGAFEGLRAVRFLNNQFVAVGEFGAVYVSLDGFAWWPYPTGFFHDLNDITFGNGLYVAVGDGGAVMTSPNLLDWDARVLGNRPLLGVAFGNGSFVAVGGTMRDEDDIAGLILTSPNGQVWSSRNARGILSLHGVEFLNGQFLALGGFDLEGGGYYSNFGPTLLSSFDGANWDIRLWSGAAYWDGLLLAASHGPEGYLVVARGATYSGSLRMSSNLSEWHDVTDQVNAALFSGVVSGSDRFVAVAAGGRTAVVLNRHISTRRPQSFGRYNFTDVEHGQGRFLALPASVYPDPVVNAVLVSTNGAGWRRCEVIARTPPVSEAGGEVVFTNLTLSDLCAGPGQFVAVGGGQMIETTNGTLLSESPFSCILSSPDGDEWTLQQWSSPDTNGGWSRVVWSGTQYLAARPTGGLAASPDGVDWVLLQSSDWEGNVPAPSLMAGGNGRFVGLRPGSSFPETAPAILVSEDGVSWSEVGITPGDNVNRITFGGGRFMAVGWNGLVLFSTNGLGWTRHNSLPGASLFSPTWTEGGYAALIYPNRLLFSPNGEQWRAYDPVPGAGFSSSGTEVVLLLGVAGGEGTLLVWGNAPSSATGLVLQSDPLSNSPPVVGVQPEDMMIGLGEMRSLSVLASGSAPLRYQWLKDGAVIPSATRSLLDILNAQAGDSAGYSVMVTNDFGAVTSRVAQVTVGEPSLDLSMRREDLWGWQEYQYYPTGTVAHSVIGMAGPTGHYWAIEHRDGLDPSNSWQTLTNVYLWHDTAEVQDLGATDSESRLYRGRLAE